MTISASLYQKKNYGGRSASMSLRYYGAFGGTPTYARLSKSALDAYDMHDRTSSIKVSATTADNDYGRLILFQDARYKGRYASFQVLSGQTTEAPKLSDIDFNDRTSSALLVRHFTQECPPIPVSILFSELAGQHIASHFIGDSVDIRDIQPRDRDDHSVRPLEGARFAHGADPIFTWDMWPSFSSNRMYVYLRAPIRIVIGGWPNYDAELRFWIYLYIDSSGTLRGYVDWYGAWVEWGWSSNFFLRSIMETLELTAFEVNRLVSEALSSWEPLTFERLYYLPGRSATGHVNDGVHLVLVTEV